MAPCVTIASLTLLLLLPVDAFISCCSSPLIQFRKVHTKYVYSNTIMMNSNFNGCRNSLIASTIAAFQIFSGTPFIPFAATPAASATISAVESSSRPFEEAWAYTDKFYLDRSHNGKDWSNVREKYILKIDAGQISETDAIKEMLSLLGDKYTRPVSPKMYESLSKFDMVGVGVMLSPNKDGILAVAAPPMPNSSAEKQGIDKGDLITAINGVSTNKMSSFDVIDFLAKYEEPTITFTVSKSIEGSQREVVLERKFEKVKNPVEYSIDSQNSGHKVGYIRVKEFNAIVTDKVKEALLTLEEQGADEFILDLRGNGGGAFQSALSVAGLFMDNQLITNMVDGDGNRVKFSTKSDSISKDYPLIIWMDKYSASASEVLAGALHDDCRAIIMGSRSFGKGLIQAVYGLSDGSGLIVTVARYETPNGTNIQGTGIKPDLEVSLPKIRKGMDQSNFELARERQKTCRAL